jgi:hypothetical protein
VRHLRRTAILAVSERDIAPALEALANQPEVATAVATETLEELHEAAQKAPEGLAGDQDVALGATRSGIF